MALENFGTNPKSNKVVGRCIGERASHCLSVASFGLRANAAAHGQAKILHSLDLFFGYFPFASRQKKVTPRREANSPLFTITPINAAAHSLDLFGYFLHQGKK